MGQLIPFPYYKPITADDVLEDAKGMLDDIVIVGYDKEGNEYFMSTYEDGPTALWHLSRASHKLMKIIDDTMEEN